MEALTLRSRRVPVAQKIEGVGKGARPGVYAMKWFGEIRYSVCAGYHSGSDPTLLVPGYGVCDDCGATWREGEKWTRQERCGACTRKALREGSPLPEMVELGIYHICAYCGETVCPDHIWLDGYGEDAEPICRACARRLKIRVNRDFD